MNFRRNKNAAQEWQAWLDRCRVRLLLCGVPEDAVESQRNWWYFLDHASMSTGKETHWFALDQLSKDQLDGLRSFLESEYGSEPYPPHLLEVVRNVTR